VIKTDDALKRLVIDIETSAHLLSTWGLFNQNIGINQIEDPTRMLSFAAKWVDNPRVAFYSEFHHGRDVMVEAAFDLVSQADAVIHYNGKGFDMKHLNREFVEHDVREQAELERLAVEEGLGRTTRFLGRPAPYHHIDMLTVVRSNFKLASNKLDYVAGPNFLNIGNKVKHPGFDLWRACMEGNQKAWALMRKYNKGDVVLTEEVYRRLLPWIDGHPNMQLYTGEQGVCHQCGSDQIQKRGTRKTLLGEYQQVWCKACGSWGRNAKSLFRADER
jgi:DNA polymerase elongation subunit (family B)